MIPFLSILFTPDDLVELRLIETWVEASKKRSLVIRTVFDRAAAFDEAAMTDINAYCQKNNANVFFGVCPRPRRESGKSSAITLCRCLWADLDHCRPAEAVGRIERAGLPTASAVVDSGNGTHAYWRLTEPIPFPAKSDTISPAAAHVEGVVRGLSAKIGGDHTSDVARLLRLPGTLNRKNARNGRQPVPCEVYAANDSRYPFTLFEPFAAPVAKPAKSPAAVAGSVVGSGDLEWDGLTERQRRVTERLIGRSAGAEVGGRSHADYALCSWAVKLGLNPDALWERVAEVGKFAERGEAYFSRTWKKAEAAVGSQRQRLAELFGF